VATWFQGFSMARSVIKEIVQRHNSWRPDVIDGHFAFPDGYAAVKSAEHLGCTSLVTCHGSDLLLYPSIIFAGSMLKWTLHRADRVISVAKALQKSSVQLGCPKGNDIFLPNGVDTELFKLRRKEECRYHAGLPVEKCIAVSVGTLNQNKNQSVLIRAIAKMRRHGANAPLLALVGDGPNSRELEMEAKRFGIQDLVFFAGERPYDEIPIWMGAGDWLVLSSIDEGWPTVYFEAMACGRPVITSNVDSAEDAVCQMKYGIIVQSNTPEGFAQAMGEAQKRKFDNCAIREYAKQHSWDNWAKNYLKIIEEVTV
jgi:glycosyltransferase involved in cell wall biosynthesis